MKKLFLIALIVIGAFFVGANVLTYADEKPEKPKPYWTEWKDTTECKVLECGTTEGVKGQERKLVVEKCEYSCPVVHWEYDLRKIHREFDVKYLKSQDPTKCHRPSVAQLREDYKMSKVEALYFTKNYPEWKRAEVGECKVRVLETQHRRTECRGEEYACGTIRWCFPDEGDHKYYAKAIPNNEEPKEGFKWETGMDKWCEYPPQEEPKDEPKENTFKEDKRCLDPKPPLPTWVNFVDGSAANGWHPLFTWSAMGGDTVEFRFSDDPDNLKWNFTTENDGHEVMGYVDEHNSGLLGNIYYYWQMRTVNGCKDGDWTDTLKVFN
jgi:hypothetical protein